MSTEANPKRVRYIKLGREGKWEPECLKDGIIRFGFGAASEERFPLCQSRSWTHLTESFLAAGKDVKTATRFTNETRLFVEDEGTTLWITFMNDCLHWGFLTPEAAERHPDGDGVFRRIRNGWRHTDAKGQPLTKFNLSGAVTKLAAYRGTSCDVDVSDYVIRRINGKTREEVDAAIDALKKMTLATVAIMKHLTPKDFEILVDLVFSTSGWRRVGEVGGTQKTKDLDLVLPSTGERAFVQVKSRTDHECLTDYIQKLSEMDSYRRMFFVYHTGFVESFDGDERVTVIGPDKLAEMVVEAGLVSWLIEKAY